MIYLFKTHYSFGKSIIQVNNYSEKENRPNLVNICVDNGIKQCFVVDDNIASLQPAFNTLSEKGISLVYGLRMSFVSNAEDFTEKGNNSSHKNIIFCRNREGTESLIKLSTKASVDFFYKEPRLDYNFLHSVWDDNLELAVPFYDSFLYNNIFTQNSCIPEFRSIKPTMFVEDHGLAFDKYIRKSVERYTTECCLEIVNTKSVYYPKKENFQSWKASKLMLRSGYSGNTSMITPNLDHCNSNTFCLHG